MSQSFMTKGEEMPQKGKGRKRKQSTPSTSQVVIRDTPAEEQVPEQPARRLRSMITRGAKSLVISEGKKTSEEE